MSYTIRATDDFEKADVTAQTESLSLANSIFNGLVLTNIYSQVELEDSAGRVLEATYPLNDAYSRFVAPYGISPK